MALATQQAVAEIENTYMMFSLGRYHFCAPVGPVQSIILMPSIRSLPMAPKGVMGTFLFREKAALACDLADVLHIEHQGETAAHQLIVVSLPQGLIAFHVDHVADIVSRAEIEGNISTDGSDQAWLDGYVNLEQENKIAFLTRFDKLYGFLNSQMDAQNVAQWLSHQRAADVCDAPSASEVNVVDTAEAVAVMPDESSPASTVEVAETSVSEPAVNPIMESPTPNVAPIDTVTMEAADTAPLVQTNAPSLGSQILVEVESSPSVASSDLTPMSSDVGGMDEDNSPGAAEIVIDDNVVSSAAGESESGLSRQQSMSQQQSLLHADIEETSTQSRSTPVADAMVPLGGEVVGGKLGIDAAVTDQDTRPLSRTSPRQESHMPKIIMGVAALAVLLIIAGVSYQWMTATPNQAKKQAVEKSVAVSAASDGPASGSNAAKSFAHSEKTAPASPTGGASASPSSAVIVDVVGKDYALRVERPAPRENKATSSPPPVVAPITPTAPKSAASAPKFAKEITHTVSGGDTLWNIAKKYLGDPYRYPELAKLSRIRDPNLIFPGDIVRIQTERKGGV